ncbi:hypothetical protein [Stenotrophomonas mori]|nr:hypothetical protein [Stenotrophomonas mori]
MGTHTYEQSVKYEIARDLLNDRIATITEQIKKKNRRPDRMLGSSRNWRI